MFGIHVSTENGYGMLRAFRRLGPALSFLVQVKGTLQAARLGSRPTDRTAMHELTIFNLWVETCL